MRLFTTAYNNFSNTRRFPGILLQSHTVLKYDFLVGDMHRPAMFSTADAALKSVPGSERIVGIFLSQFIQCHQTSHPFFVKVGMKIDFRPFQGYFIPSQMSNPFLLECLQAFSASVRTNVRLQLQVYTLVPKNARALHPHPAIKVPMMGLRSFPSFCVDVVLVEIQKVGKKTENPVYFLNR